VYGVRCRMIQYLSSKWKSDVLANLKSAVLEWSSLRHNDEFTVADVAANVGLWFHPSEQRDDGDEEVCDFIEDMCDKIFGPLQ